MTRWRDLRRRLGPRHRTAAIVTAVSAALLAAGATATATVIASGASASPAVRSATAVGAWRSSGTSAPVGRLGSRGSWTPSGGPAAAAPVSCTIRDFPTLGGLYGNAIAAAANGDVVGLADDTAGVPRAVMWRAAKPQQIRTGIAGSVPTGLNAKGDVVGSGPDGENTLGWVWSGHRTVRLRGTGERTPLPAAISDGGVVAGALESSEGTPGEGGDKAGATEDEQAAVWRSPTAPPQILAPLSGDQGAHAYAVADDGRIGGVSEGASFRPVVWDLAGRPHQLPGLGGGYGIVRAFGPGGVAVGDAVAKDGSDHAVMWAADGRITDLALPAGSRAAQATGMLPGGVVMGTAEVRVAGGGVRAAAVRWPATGQPQLLGGQNNPGQTVLAGAASARTAVGYRTDAKGGRHPVMWRCG